jgi:hypothetical protein
MPVYFMEYVSKVPAIVAPLRQQSAKTNEIVADGF